VLRFKRFSAEVLHLPGHTPGLVCSGPRRRVPFGRPPARARVANPLLDLEGQTEPTHKALVAISTPRAGARFLAELIAPGPRSCSGRRDHRRLLAFYDRRQQRILELAPGPAPADLAPLVPTRASTSSPDSRVMGNLKSQRGAASGAASAGCIRFEAV
jgi:hypothetical protein